MILPPVTVLTASIVIAVGLSIADRNENTFDWAGVEPTTELRYHACYDGFRCARLKVQMDWNDPSENNAVAIAITALPAKVAVDHPDYGGTIITNPGGPGSSVIDLVQRFGHHLQQVLGGKKRYEVMSFDSRGVRFITPVIDCFSDMFGRDAFELEMRGLGLLGSSEDALKRYLDLYAAVGLLCDSTVGDSDILKHPNTAAVSGDMVEIVDRTDELKKRDLATRWRAANEPTQYPITDTHESRPRDIARNQYIGFSYGTVQGNAFACMFPGRIGRLVIDGVIDMNDWMNGLYSRYLIDTEAIIDYFYDACYDAGDRCPIRNFSDQKGADIKARIKFIADADASPLPFIQGSNIYAVTGND